MQELCGDVHAVEGRRREEMNVLLQVVEQKLAENVQSVDQKLFDAMQANKEDIRQGNCILEKNMRVLCEDLVEKCAVKQNTDRAQNAATSALVMPVIDALQKSFEEKILNLRQDTVGIFAKLAEGQTKTNEKVAEIQ